EQNAGIGRSSRLGIDTDLAADERVLRPAVEIDAVTSGLPCSVRRTQALECDVDKRIPLAGDLAQLLGSGRLARALEHREVGEQTTLRRHLNMSAMLVVAVVGGAMRARWPIIVGAVTPIRCTADFAQTSWDESRNVPCVGADVVSDDIRTTTSLLPSAAHE